MINFTKLLPLYTYKYTRSEITEVIFRLQQIIRTHYICRYDLNDQISGYTEIKL
jgi:hypothetical protein